MSSEKDYSVLPEVTVIQESAKIESEEHKPKKLRVCAYARVSTEKEEQEYSFENQRDYYMDYISKRSDWEFVGIYSDFGLSGKNKKRPQFIKMIDDCHAGKIDRIITKSISRFARNTIDCIQTVRDLREKGIGVYFEREGIDSLSPQSALVLSIMAIVAEEESRSISNNIKWAIQKQFAQGHYLIHTKHFLGYSREEDNRIIIIPKQALAVRSIYQLYLDGKSIHQIALEMELREIESPEGNKNWGDSTILSILKNEKYKGDCLLQKTYSPDFLASKRYKNTGQLRSYYVKSHHAPIILSAMFDEVQNEMQRRKDLRTGSKAYPSKYSGKSCLSGLLICGQCGGVMRRHVQYRKGGGIGYWVCQRHDQGSCSMMQIKEKVIIDGLQMVIRQILFQKEPLYTEMTDTIINSAIVLSDGSVIPAASPVMKDGQVVMEESQQQAVLEDGSVAMDEINGIMIPATVPVQGPKLERTKLPYYTPSKFPIIIRKNTSQEDSLFGQSDCEFIRPQQQAINKIESRILEKLMSAGVYPTAPEDYIGQFDNGLYKNVIKVGQGNYKLFGRIDLQVDLTQDISQSKRLYQQSKRIMGITDSYQGQADSTAQSGKAKQIQVNQSAA